MSDSSNSTEPADIGPPALEKMPLAVAVCALGIAQIISWGGLYYAIAVIGDSMRRELGISQAMLFGAFTGSLVLSGLAAPTVGELIDAHGGRRVLMAGSCLSAVALGLFAVADGPASLPLASGAAGIAMALCLYDAAFITLNQIAGERYRTAVTMLTLFGGLASTVFWPLSQWLLDGYGWRQTLTMYAGLQLLVCLPLHRFALPGRTSGERSGHQALRNACVKEAAPRMDFGARYSWLAAAFAGGSFVLAVLSVHLIGLFKGAGLDAKQAVFIASLVGPMQVLGRVIELAFASRLRPVAVGALAFGLMPAALLVLLWVPQWTALAFAVALLYGLSNGLLTIVRGTVPAVLFGRTAYGVLLGRLARPAFIARALAPAALPFAMAAGLNQRTAILLLAACAGIALAAYWRACIERGN